MGCSAKAVANYFLDLAEEKEEPLTPLKVQKLVYIAHGWYLALSKEALISDEYAEAWQYGPVFPSIYYEFKWFGSNKITDRAEELVSFNQLSGTWKKIIPLVPSQDKITCTFLDRIWKVYSPYNAIVLSEMTHEEGTPWSLTKEEDDKINAHIPNCRIKEYYEKRLKDSE